MTKHTGFSGMFSCPDPPLPSTLEKSGWEESRNVEQMSEIWREGWISGFKTP